MKFLNKFIFRTPLNSFAEKNAWVIKDNRYFLEALYLSSPTLLEELKKQNESVSADQFSKLAVSLYKYQVRAANRCTPFGLFAGLGIGEWGNKNEIVLDADFAKELKRKTRLDMNVVCALAQELAKKNYIKPYLKFYPNNSIYLIADTYRYIEYHYVNDRRHHKINKVDYNEFLQLIFEKSETGLTHDQICNILVSDEVTNDEASGFVNELINSQLLINQLEPNVTGDDYFYVLCTQLRSILNAHPSDELDTILNVLFEIEIAIKNCDANVTNTVESYNNIHKRLKAILPELSEINLFQTDLYKNANIAELNKNIQSRILEVMQFLNRITPPQQNQNMMEFKKRFSENYEDYEIPFSIALDAETGIGYPVKDSSGINDLVDDIQVNQTNEESKLNWSSRESYLLKLLSDARANKMSLVELSDTDFKKVDFSKDSVLPNSLSVMFKLMNADSGKLSLKHIGGASAACLLGRFAGGNKILLNALKEIANFEQGLCPEKILAEIVHLPESRTGNILARPVFRNFEIPYLAKSSVAKEFQINMNDLVLKIVQDKIILFDKRQGKEIIPCLGNAHNYSINSLPVYHFLCDLQTQYFTKTNLGFHWGVLENQFDFLPRVEYKNIILSEAKWRLKNEELGIFSDKKKNITDKRKHFLTLKEKHNLPDLFLIAENDNELLIDCKKQVAIDAFIDVAKNKSELILEEYLFESPNTLVKDSKGNPFTNECIAILLNETNKESNKMPLKLTDSFLSKTTFSIGSEWLFYKIYCGPKTADFILTQKIKPLVDTFFEQNAIDKWFFIRYADPDVHLRVRFHICDMTQYGNLIQTVHNTLEPLVQQHLISKLTTDTYKREIERYGDSSIKFVEQLFCNDSSFVADAIGMLDAESGGTIRWQLGIRSVDTLFNDFKLDETIKFNLISQLSTSFFNEHGGQKELKVTLDTKFRNLRPKIEEALDTTNDLEKEYYPLIELLQNRSKANEEPIKAILELWKHGTLQVELTSLLANIVHMNIDRLFMGRNRTNEFVVYDMLSRHYRSINARKKLTKVII